MAIFDPLNVWLWNIKKATEDLKNKKNNLADLPDKIDFTAVLSKPWYKQVWQMQQWQTINQVLWNPVFWWVKTPFPVKQVLTDKQLKTLNNKIPTKIVQKTTPTPSIVNSIIPTASANQEKFLSKQKIKEIIGWRPEWVEAIDLFNSLEEKGYIIEWYNDLKTPQQPVPVEQPTIKDLHPEEWFLEQTWKAWLRWLKNVWLWTLESIWTLWQWATNLLSKGYQWISNTITWDNTSATQFENPYIALSNEYQWNTQNELKPTTAFNDLSKYWAWLSTSAFNVVKAPLSVWLSTAWELPWTQYIMQWLSKAIEWTWKELANVTGIDEDTMQNIITTWMNTLWLKVKGWWTIETAWKMKTAFKEAPTPLKWVLNAWKVWVKETVKPILDIAKMPVTVPYWVAKWWVNLVWKWLNKVWIKSPLSQEYVPAKTEWWHIFEVEKTPWLKTNISDKLFKKPNEILAQQSVFPKATKEKTSEARLKASEIALNWIKQIYEDKAKWNIKSDISTMWWWVEWLNEALDFHWSKIWDLTDKTVKINTTDLVSNLKQSLYTPFSWVNSSMKTLVSNIVNEFENIWKKKNEITWKIEQWPVEVSVKDLQNWLSNIKSEIFDNRETISKLYKTNTWKALNEFLKNIEERFNTTIEETSWNSKDLLEAKSKYSKLKKIQKDLTDSYMVELRNQGKWITWTAWKIVWLYEVLSNPSISWILKAVALKQAWETMQYYKSRWWNYETLIRNLDREAINRNLKPNPIIKNDNWNNSFNSSNTDNKKFIKPTILKKKVDNFETKTDPNYNTRLLKSEDKIYNDTLRQKEVIQNTWKPQKISNIFENNPKYQEFKKKELERQHKILIDEWFWLTTSKKDIRSSLISNYWDDLTNSFKKFADAENKLLTSKSIWKYDSDVWKTELHKNFIAEADNFITERWLNKSPDDIKQELLDLVEWTDFLAKIPDLKAKKESFRKTTKQILNTKIKTNK